ncbi:hypothetical protein [Candidatus Methylocalor cossyra]|uniref:Uncharacterized protein n=1 Tax=Candidatus Methylocalor cossyra TaxID=3108543 RepID=A0ABM9NIA9_9GAMM
MSKSFQVKLNRPAAEILAQAQEAARANGIHFGGDGEAGTFAGHGIEGSYRIDGDILSVHISKKPFLLPWSVIESRLRIFFA